MDIEARDLVVHALSRLEPDKRAVIMLHDIDGFDAPEIAQALEIPINTVYSRLRTARQELARIVERLGGRR